MPEIDDGEKQVLRNCLIELNNEVASKIQKEVKGALGGV